MSAKHTNLPQEATLAPHSLPGRSNNEPFPHQTKIFLLLMLLSVVVRVVILMTSRHYLTSDEAVTGMETMDIIEGGPIPAFMYGQSYGGGHTVEALLALPWFVVFGSADYWLKLGPTLLSWVQILLVYYTLYRFFDKKLALIAAALLSMFAPFLAAGFIANARMVTLTVGWLGLHLFFRQYFAEREKRLSALLAGVAIGFAYYSFDFGLYYLFAVILLWIIKENIYLWKQWRSLLSFALGFAIGAAVLIYQNLTHNFNNIKHLLNVAGTSGDSLVFSSFERFATLLYHDFPAFFSVKVDDFSQDISVLSYI